MNHHARYAIAVFLTLFAVPCCGAQLTRAFAVSESDASRIAEQLRKASIDGRAVDSATLADIGGLKRFDKTRWVDATQGDVIEVFGLYYESDSKHLRLGMEETPRERRIDEDLRTLVKLAAKIRGFGLAQPRVPRVFAERAQFRLREVRASVTFSAELLDAANPIAADNYGPPKWIVFLDLTAGGTNKTNASLATKEVVTGPREAWSMSVALPVNTVSQLKLNTETNEVEPKDEPGAFYVSLDYTFGDYFVSTRELPDALMVKFMIKASKEPLDSYGVGIGFKPGFFDRWTGFEILDRISPFVGWTFTREDVTRDDGTVAEDAARNAEVRYGLSYDLSRALKWVKE